MIKSTSELFDNHAGVWIIMGILLLVFPFLYKNELEEQDKFWVRIVMIIGAVLSVSGIAKGRTKFGNNAKTMMLLSIVALVIIATVLAFINKDITNNKNLAMTIPSWISFAIAIILYVMYMIHNDKKV